MERLSCVLLRSQRLTRLSGYPMSYTIQYRQPVRCLISQRCFSFTSQNYGRISVQHKPCLLTSYNLRNNILKDSHLKTRCIEGFYSIRCIHLSGRRNVIPPLFWIPIGFASKAAAALTGRQYRNWLKKQSPEVQRKHWRGIYALLASLFSFTTIIGMMYYKYHTQKVPLTGRERFITLTPEQYLKVAEYETESYVDTYGEADALLPPGHPRVERVVKVVNRIIRANTDFPVIHRPEWIVYVVKDEEKNAFVLPNGTMFVFTGMLDFVQNDDQLAFILAHEMSHALLLHGAEQLSYSQFLDYFVILFMAAVWLIIPSDGIAIITQWFYKKVMNLTIHMPYSRVLEKEADEVGLHLLAKACYDVREGSVLWSRMSIMDDVAGELRLPQWLSTHPTHDKRVEHMNFLMTRAMSLRTEYSCPPLSDNDPREGVVVLRKLADEMKIHRATKSNTERTHVDYLKNNKS
ncbi:metalloendopeptidase [Mactra antiquata]